MEKKAKEKIETNTHWVKVEEKATLRKLGKLNQTSQLKKGTKRNTPWGKPLTGLKKSKLNGVDLSDSSREGAGEWEGEAEKKRINQKSKGKKRGRLEEKRGKKGQSGKGTKRKKKVLAFNIKGKTVSEKRLEQTRT